MATALLILAMTFPAGVDIDVPLHHGCGRTINLPACEREAVTPAASTRFVGFTQRFGTQYAEFRLRNYGVIDLYFKGFSEGGVEHYVEVHESGVWRPDLRRGIAIALSAIQVLRPGQERGFLVSIEDESLLFRAGVAVSAHEEMFCLGPDSVFWSGPVDPT